MNSFFDEENDAKKSILSQKQRVELSLRSKKNYYKVMAREVAISLEINIPDISLKEKNRIVNLLA